MDEYATTGMVFYLFGLFSAYWAQQTRRSAWLWFFLGLCLAPVAGVILLLKNAGDLDKKNAARTTFTAD